MKETVHIFDGKGIIHLRGGPSDAILFVKKEPRMACFFAEIGTVMRYHVGQEIDEYLLRENYEYENLVREGRLDPQKSLSSQFHHLTQLLTNGSYSLHFCEFPWQLDVLPAIAKEETKRYYDKYGGTVDLITTQTYLNAEVVDTYKQAIMKGARPIVVLYKIEDSWAIFILDGHHKLHAYRELKKNPRAFVISKLDAKGIDAEQGVEWMKKMGLDGTQFVEIYREEKETKAHQENFYHYYAKGLQTYFK